VLDVSRDRISYYFNSYGNHAAQPLCRLDENFQDNARDNAGGGMCAGGGDRRAPTHRGGCGGYRCGHWRRRKRGKFGGANAILNSPPGDVPVIDNVRPLDRKPFARSVTKFMKVSSALAVDNCERERESAPAGCARAAERALDVYSYRTGIVAGNMFRSFLYWNYVRVREGHSRRELPADFLRGRNFRLL